MTPIARSLLMGVMEKNDTSWGGVMEKNDALGGTRGQIGRGAPSKPGVLKLWVMSKRGVLTLSKPIPKNGVLKI